MTGIALTAAALAAAGAAFGVWQWAARRRTLRRLNAMLDRAIAGGFSEERFDETELSALEGRLARFLRGSAAARRTVETEQAAVKTLIADISHQTRTPIANLLLYASLLSESELDPRQLEQVNALSAQAEKLSFLIKALVKASRLEAGIVAPAPAVNPVGPLLENAVEQEGPAALAKQITLTAEPFDGSAAFDPRWTGEALGNVVNNAVKYTPPGGRVSVSAQLLDSFCRIDVADTGPGVPESEQAAVFNRFYRVDAGRSRETGGTGLGLAIVKHAARCHDAQLRIESELEYPGQIKVHMIRESRAIDYAK